MKKSRLLLLIVFMLCQHIVFSQNDYKLGWLASSTSLTTKTTSNYSSYFENAIDVDNSGNTYAVGNFLYTTDFDPGPANTNTTSAGTMPNVFIQKLDQNGALVWVKTLDIYYINPISPTTINGWGYSLKVDNNQDVYVTGILGPGTYDMDPGPAINNVTILNTGNTMFLLKLNTNGDFVWVKTFSNASGANYFSIRNKINITQPKPANCFLGIDNLNNVYIGGTLTPGTQDLDPGTGVFNVTVAVSANSPFIVKLDQAGNFQFAKVLDSYTPNGSQATSTNGFCIGPSGEICITGTFSGTLDLDPGAGQTLVTGVGAGGGIQDVFLVKLDALGNFIWGYKFGGDSGQEESIGAVNVDPGGNVILGFSFSNTIDVDPGPGVTNLVSASLMDACIVKLSPAGGFIWGYSFDGSSGSASEYLRDIKTDINSNIYFTLNYSFRVSDLDPSPSNIVQLGNNYNQSSAIVKWTKDAGYINAFGVGCVGFQINSIAVKNGIIYAGGSFYTNGTVDYFNDMDPSEVYAPTTSNITTTFTAAYIQDGCYNFNTLASSLQTSYPTSESGTDLSKPMELLSNDGSCTLIAALTKCTTGTLGFGIYTGKVWIDNVQRNFVKRHFEINNTFNPGVYKGTTMTLYATQQEFDDFNALPINSLKLPTGPGDLLGIANLKIEERGGTSSDGSGAFNTYSGTITTIDPNDANIIWNSAASRWEITFTPAGLSGFWIKTKLTALPITWISFDGQLTSSNLVNLTWKVEEVNSLGYAVERSYDGVNFSEIGIVGSTGNGSNNYFYTDRTGGENRLLFYRIKMLNSDDKSSYSSIIKVRNRVNINSTPLIYPNPVKNTMNLEVDKNMVNSTAVFYNSAGVKIKSVLLTERISTIDLSGIKPGLYFIKIGNSKSFIKWVKL